jgi:hypothetical protein
MSDEPTKSWSIKMQNVIIQRQSVFFKVFVYFACFNMSLTSH